MTSLSPPSLHPTSLHPGMAPQPAAPSALAPTVLLRAVRKHWLLIVLGLAVSVVGAFAYTARQTKIYEAVATVQLDPQPLMPLGNQPGGETGPGVYWSNQEYFATQYQILTSRRVASLVVRKLALHRDAAFLTSAEPGTKAAPREASMDAAAEILRSRLKVKPITDSRLAVVSYRDADPDRAQRILSAVTDIYVDQNLDATLDSANKRAEWLDTQLTKLKAELESQEMDLHDFKKNNNLLSVSFDDQTNMLRAEIQQLNATLTDLKTRREQVAARLNTLEKINPNDPAAIPQGELLGNSGLAALRANYLTAKMKVDHLTALGKGANHPEVLAAEADLRSAREAPMTELRNVRDGVANDLESVQRELAGVTQLFESAKTQAMGLNINEVRFTRLRRTKDNTERVFGLVLERSTESGMSKLMPFNNVRVLDRPLKPGGPVAPRPLVNLAVGAALGLLLGFAGALGRELLDRTVRGAEDVEQEIGIPALGSLPEVSEKSARTSLYYGHRDKPGKQGRHDGADAEQPQEGPLVAELLVHSHPKSSAAEAARAIRTNLLFMSPDKPYRTLLVTSPGPAEGKTTVASSIAIAMSQTGQRVCLVDCDLRRPRVHTLFDCPAGRGLTTALLDMENLDSHITATPAPNLWILPAGPTPPNPADIMHSEAFARLLDGLKNRFDKLVIDSPPVCLVTDAVVASTRVDAVILVLRPHLTRREAARRALRSLADVGANLPGFVLNAVVPTGERYEYSYYTRYEASEEKQA
jgi:polysaccharide biosynthesis transport protein